MRSQAPVAAALALLPLMVLLPPLEGSGPQRVLEASDTLLQGLLVRLRGRRAVPRDPLVLAIDEDSLALDRVLSPEERRRYPLRERMGPWPWPRELQAALAERLLRSGARQVVFNVVQAQPSPRGPADDRAFVATLAPWRERVVLAAAVLDGDDRSGLRTTTLLRPTAAIAAAGFRRVGVTNLLQSPQGVTEAIPGQSWLDQALGDTGVSVPPPLAVVASGQALARQPVLLDPRAAQEAPRQVPAWQLEEMPATLWRERTVLIGVTAATLGDQLETPFGPRSGTELQAEALATLGQRSGRTRPSEGMTLLLLSLWAAAVTLTLGRDRPAARLVLLGSCLILLALAGSALAWLALGLRLPASALVLAPLLATVGVAAPRWGQEARERAALQQALSRRLAPALLADLLRQPAAMGERLGGERCRCVVLFADLVGFTTLSHSMEADALFALLNQWFAVVARPVLEEGGLVDKFIGDAVMAEFGLPRSRGDRQEALAAARAALRMQSALVGLNRERAAAGQTPLRMGIALHVGEVMAGNLGLPERLEYSAIGAAVNVTSRLEALTRQFSEQQVLISGELLGLIADRVETLPLGHHKLRGWPEPVEVHGLRALRP